MLKIALTGALYILAATSLIVGPAAAETQIEPVRDISQDRVTERQLEAAIASRTLTWLTGSSANNDYVSVGRIANYFGFVGLRVASGHSLSRSDVAFDTLAVLDDRQRQKLIDLTGDLSEPLSQTHTARQAMNRALEGMLVDDALSYEDFAHLARAYSVGEAQTGGVIAQRFGQIAASLNTEQVEALAAIRAMHISGQGHLVELKKPKIRLPKAEKQELVNAAARFLSWTTGSPEYNDFEVVGKPSQHFGFVSLRIDSNHGVKRGGVAREVEDLLTPQQRALIAQAAALNTETFETFLDRRSNLLRYLETALDGRDIDPNIVARLGAELGTIEADMTWSQAMTMLEIRDLMTDAQANALLELRTKYTMADQASFSSDVLVRGQQLFAQCALCHNASSANAIAPDLSQIVGRPIGADAGFENYSPAFRARAERGDVWSESLLDAFLASPQDAVPGTIMGFAGLENAADRAAIIAYLETLDWR